MINSFHPGRASYQEFNGMGHGLNLWPSQAAFLEGRGKKMPFDTEFLQRIADWMRERLKA
jgi:hypothetical protein